MKPTRCMLIVSTALLLSASAAASAARAPQKEPVMTPATRLLRHVNPPNAAIPGVSSAVVVESGRTVFLSGHVPTNADGAVVAADLETQLEQVFSNLRQTLAAVDATPAHLARITLYVRDFNAAQLPIIRSARDRFIDPDQPPASALIGVADLFHPDVLVEVDAVAVLPPKA